MPLTDINLKIVEEMGNINLVKCMEGQKEKVFFRKTAKYCKPANRTFPERLQF